MSGAKHAAGELDSRRRRLVFRSWHRGMRETDLILGPFADANAAGLTDGELEQYETLLDVSDTDLLPMLTGQRAVPDGLRTPLFDRIIQFSHARAERP
jgi:antitoxin CptB